MKVDEIKNISVLGAGIMGHGIAQAFLMGGYPVKLYDIRDSILETARSHIQESLRLFHDAGLIKKRDIEPAIEALTLTTDLKKAVEGADFVVEAVPENLALKQALFEKLEPMVRENTIIASNTSSLTLTGIGEKVKSQGRLVITHWFNPPHIVPTVEVVKGKETTDATADVAVSTVEKDPEGAGQDQPGHPRVSGEPHSNGHDPGGVGSVREGCGERGGHRQGHQGEHGIPPGQHRAAVSPQIWADWTSGSAYTKTWPRRSEAPRRPPRP